MLGALLPAIIAGGASILGSKMTGDTSEANAQRNIAMQKQFAQQGIQWKVQDAKKAGVHPLYALGANTQSFSPVSVSGGIGEGISQAGQDLSRAVHSVSSPTAKLTAVHGALQTERMGLENELLRSQIARLNQNPAVGFPANNWLVDGQGNAATVDSGDIARMIKNQPLKRTVADPTALHQEPGAITDVGYSKTALGSYYPVPSDDIKQRIEDNLPHEVAHFIRNNIVPQFSGGSPPYPAPEGKAWSYDIYRGYILKDLHPARRWLEDKYGRR